MPAASAAPRSRSRFQSLEVEPHRSRALPAAAQEVDHEEHGNQREADTGGLVHEVQPRPVHDVRRDERRGLLPQRRALGEGVHEGDERPRARGRDRDPEHEPDLGAERASVGEGPRRLSGASAGGPGRPGPPGIAGWSGVPSTLLMGPTVRRRPGPRRRGRPEGRGTDARRPAAPGAASASRHGGWGERPGARGPRAPRASPDDCDGPARNAGQDGGVAEGMTCAGAHRFRLLENDRHAPREPVRDRDRRRRRRVARAGPRARRIPRRRCGPPAGRGAPARDVRAPDRGGVRHRRAVRLPRPPPEDDVRHRPLRVDRLPRAPRCPRSRTRSAPPSSCCTARSQTSGGARSTPPSSSSSSGTESDVRSASTRSRGRRRTRARSGSPPTPPTPRS